MDLLEIRNQLDQIDAQIISLYEQRMELCKEVANFKIETGKAVFDKEREQQKIRSVKALAHGAFHQQAAEEIFTQLMTISRRYQYQLLEQHGKSMETGFRIVPSLPLKDSKIVYQGVEGAYSHAAALQYFGAEADVYHVRTWEEAMNDVERGVADYAVIPIENSSAGAVIDNYDALIKHSNVIAAETFLTVNHALLGVPGADISDIGTVYSHPQALMQCSEFLSQHPQWRQISVENTAVAAQKVLADQDPNQAAIASEDAGRRYGLAVLQSTINHNKENMTRFLILTRERIYTQTADKISICFELPHRSGSLYNMLGNFIYNGVNLMMIESRPILGKNWEYRFFVDIEGNLSDSSIQNALKSISEEAANLQILGNY
ncbi:MAG: prephenate dehydratase [Hungatella sp.]